MDADINQQCKLVLDPREHGFHYETLGRIIRSNVVRGSPIKYDQGVTHADFNRAVFDRGEQQQTGQTSQHHKQRDDLSMLYTYVFKVRLRADSSDRERGIEA